MPKDMICELLFLRFFCVQSISVRQEQAGAKHQPTPVSMKINILSFVFACAAMLASCGPKSIPASQTESISEYDDGVALLRTTGGYWYFVDENRVPIAEDSRISSIGDEFKDGLILATVESSNPDHGEYQVLDRHGNVKLSSSSPFLSDLLPGSRIWVASDKLTKTFDLAVGYEVSRPRGISLVDIPSGKVLITEDAVLKDCTASGTAVLSRTFTGRHPQWYENAYLVEFMLVGGDGGIIAPWGRIGYIGNFSKGLAPASYCQAGRNIQHKEVYACDNQRNLAKLGFIDEGGHMVIEPRFEEVSDFNDKGYSRVQIKKPTLYSDGKNYKYIDMRGRILSGAEEAEARRSYVGAENTNTYY